MFLPEAPLRLGGAQRGERRAPKGGPAPLAEVPHQRGMLVPFQRDKWFDRFDRLTALRSSKGRLTTPRKIEGPNLSSLPCWKGRDRVQRESWHK